MMGMSNKARGGGGALVKRAGCDADSAGRVLACLQIGDGDVTEADSVGPLPPTHLTQV